MRRRLLLTLSILLALLAIIMTLKYKERLSMYFISRNYDELLPAERVVARISLRPGVKNELVANMAHFKINLSTRLKNAAGIKAPLGDPGDVNAMMITINTWGGHFIGPYFNSPLKAILRGEYDQSLQILFQKYKGMGDAVYFRLNPEMEVPAWHYPWQRNRNTYIKSFHYVANLLKIHAPDANLVWGPAGYPGSMEFYPGDAYVHANTVTIKSDSERKLDVYPQDYPAGYDLFRRIHRLRFTSKPIFILVPEHLKTNPIDQVTVQKLDSIIQANRAVAYNPDLFTRHATNPIFRKDDQVVIGFYDPNELLVSNPAVQVEHLFADFGNLADGSFQESFERAIGRKRDLIVTFEPFRHPVKGRDNAVLRHISLGQYDRELAAFFKILLSTERIIYLRYAHEMEIPITRYPWQSQDPLVYIESFRYFMDFVKPLPSNIRKVWGPAGDRGSIEWWPGNDVVDFVSVAIYGLPDKNITDPNEQESFTTIYKRKAMRMRFINKPIFIAEFGVKGPQEYQIRWLLDAARTIQEHPQIIGVNYFNMTDTPKAWGDIKPPDWSISNSTFELFLKALSEPIPSSD